MVFIAGHLFVASNLAKATSEPDWLQTGAMVVNSKEQIPWRGNTDVQACNGGQIDVQWPSGVWRVFACVVKSKNMSIASGPGGKYISFKGDSYFYRINAPDIRQIVIAAGSDRVAIERWATGTNYISVYDNIRGLLTFNPSMRSYEVAGWDNPLFPVSNGASSVRGSAPALSNNGKYMVYNTAAGSPGNRNTKGRVIRVDLDKGESKQFGSEWFGRFPYNYPEPHFAITNDGQYAIGGGSDILFLWRIVSDCLEDFPDHNYNVGIQMCGGRGISAENYGEIQTPYSERTYGLRFSDDGNRISFVYHQGVYKQITISPAGYVPTHGMDYLALGDSFSSGEGDIERDQYDNKYYRSGTNVNGSSILPREKCHISTRSYPYVLARGMDLSLDSPRQWNTVACSGAVVKDVRSQFDTEYYQGQPLDDSGKGRLDGFGNVSQLKTKALNEFIPGREKQIEFVKKHKPRVITLTMGGNDIGFGEKIKDCAWPGAGTCRYAKPEGRAALASQISGQYDDLKLLYTELYEASGRQSKIYVLGYPHFISKEEMFSCSGIASLNHDERQMIHHSVTYMNNVIETAAAAAGVKYIDIEHSLNGHKLCDDAEQHVTGVVGVPASLKNDPQESFHPNAKGHFAIAMTVWDKVNNESLLDYDICPNTSENICPDLNATKQNIPVPAYFHGSTEGKTSIYQRFTSYIVKKSSPIRIMTDPHLFRPSSSVNATIHSDPIYLGDYTIASDGSFVQDVVIPDLLPAGYHTIILTGETYSGEAIEIEQVVLVHGADPDDIDENGISDSKQPCGPFMPLDETEANLDAPCSDTGEKKIADGGGYGIVNGQNRVGYSDPSDIGIPKQGVGADVNLERVVARGSRDDSENNRKGISLESVLSENKNVSTSTKETLWLWFLFSGGLAVAVLVGVIIAKRTARLKAEAD